MLRLTYECLCTVKNSSESVNVGQELQLVTARLVSLMWSSEVKTDLKYPANSVTLHIF